MSRFARIVAFLAFLALAIAAAVGIPILQRQRDIGLENRRKQCQSVLEEFMRRMNKKEVSVAQFLWAKGSLERFDMHAFNRTTEDGIGYKYCGYKSLFILRVDTVPRSSMPPYAVSGKYVAVAARICYNDGSSAKMEARLHKDDDGWRLWSIQITVPKQKIEWYMRGIAA